MKEVIKCSIAGVAFTLDTDAYDTLRRYLDTLNDTYRTTPDGPEIVADIEARIAELILTAQDGSRVVDLPLVRNIIAQLGTPEDISGRGESPADGTPRIPRRFYRDTANARLGGVCSGVGRYFDIDEDKLFNIAKTAKEDGVELFVLDDGWFGVRNSDRSGLGDWSVNEKKLPGGLEALVPRIQALGMSFGIWIEPEMISEDSDLYREHPDWALRIPGRTPARGRNQLVLDFSRLEIRQHVYGQIKAVLSSADIAYVKWDMNRSLSDVWSAALPAERQGEVYHRYVLGVYEILDQLRRDFPHILIEGCAGGGGRFDAGMLYYTPQIWCSDNTDAIDRLRIQYGTSFCYPVSAMGAHVSAVPNEANGRVTPLETRGTVAMSGTFGYEMDPNQTTPEELYARIQGEAPGLFTVLLAHRNDHFGQYANAGYDFILSGHGHGGIVRLPFLGGLIGTNRRLFPQWTSGLYAQGDSVLFVSRGLGNNTVPFQGFRIFNRPELAVVTLKS